MNNVERFRATLNFEKTDRMPVIEWATWWNETTDKWKENGFPKELNDITLMSEHLGLDSLRQYWLVPRTAKCPAPKYHGAALLSNSNDYENFKRSGFLFPETTFSEDDLKIWNEKMEAGDTVIWITFEGFFWFPRTLFGIENHLFAFYDEPELMHRMNQELVDFYLEELDKFTQLSTPIFMTFAEDMSYNHGPMLSKELFDVFLAPYYNQLIPELKKRGIKVFVDSDGDVMPLIPWLKGVGVEGILPLERMAGVDVGEIRKNHPDFLMLGGFDKTVMHKGEKAMRNEFERLLPTMKAGGFISSVDHQTPPDVSLDNYNVYVKLLKEYAEKASLVNISLAT